VAVGPALNAWTTDIHDNNGGIQVDNNPSKSRQARRRVIELVSRAEAIVEALEAGAVDGRWAMTAFSRYRLCDLLDITPYIPYVGDLEHDPAALLEEAAGMVDAIDVPIEELSWRLALGDALRTAADDVRRVQDARDV
jgi:hypothetical protein